MVISCSTCQKEEWVKYVIHAVLPQFQFCCNLCNFQPNPNFQNFRIYKKKQLIATVYLTHNRIGVAGHNIFFSLKFLLKIQEFKKIVSRKTMSPYLLFSATLHHLFHLPQHLAYFVSLFLLSPSSTTCPLLPILLLFSSFITCSCVVCYSRNLWRKKNSLTNPAIVFTGTNRLIGQKETGVAYQDPNQPF